MGRRGGFVGGGHVGSGLSGGDGGRGVEEAIVWEGLGYRSASSWLREDLVFWDGSSEGGWLVPMRWAIDVAVREGKRYNGHLMPLPLIRDLTNLSLRRVSQVLCVLGFVMEMLNEVVVKQIRSPMPS